MKTFQIELSCFHGFYETIWSPCQETIREELDEKGVTLHDGWRFNTKDWEKDTCEFYTAKYLDLIRDELGIEVVNLEYSFLSSPKYYNYENDRLFADITVPNYLKFISRVRTLMQENREYLEKVIREDFTSRDGFISFLPNTYWEWFVQIEDNATILAQTLGYLLTAKVRQEWDMEYVDHLIYDDREIYEANYIYPETEEAKEEYEKLLETEAERAWDREHLQELPFAWE